MAEVTRDEMHVDPIEAWLRTATADAERRGLPELKPLLETLAQSTRRLRAAEWNSYVPADGRRLTADGNASPGGRRETTR
jgi:hypothetical protein